LVNPVRVCGALLVLGLAAGLVLACTPDDGGESPPEVTTRATMRVPDSPWMAQDPLPLNQVRFWAYQLQDLSAPGAIDALVNSHYDMLVLEPTRTDWSSEERYFDTKGMVARVKGSPASDGTHRKLVLAYVNIGEAEDWRWYWTWSRGWKCRGKPPDDWPVYILACDPDGWGGDYPVAYWESAWRDLLLYGIQQDDDADRDYVSIIDEVIQDGFDGIYLDWVEAFDDEDVAAAADEAGLDPADEMVVLIREIRDYVGARNPRFRVIQQNAVSLVEGHPELPQLVDAIAQEAVWFDGDATDEWEDPDGYDSENDEELTAYYLGYLEQYAEAGLPVFVCEYALEYAGRAYADAYAAGFVPYVTRTPLSRLTTTYPPGY
jgi:cysteinyl-tRNA synthetase